LGYSLSRSQRYSWTPICSNHGLIPFHTCCFPHSTFSDSSLHWHTSLSCASRPPTQPPLHLIYQIPTSQLSSPRENALPPPPPCCHLRGAQSPGHVETVERHGPHRWCLTLWVRLTWVCSSGRATPRFRPRRRFLGRRSWRAC
jgi:hypothetical protein